jgi:hypothetical protein
MATELVGNEISKIGAAAGMVWQHLDQNGAVTLSKLVKEIDAPRDQVMQGIGWLAREGKIRFDETSRSKVISLK